MSTQFTFSNIFIFSLKGDFLRLFPPSLPLSIYLSLSLSLSRSIMGLSASLLALVCTLSAVTLWCAATWFHSPPWWHRSNLQVCRGKTDEEIQLFISFLLKAFTVTRQYNAQGTQTLCGYWVLVLIQGSKNSIIWSFCRRNLNSQESFSRKVLAWLNLWTFFKTFN